jgi:hypothetical protein
MVYHGLSWFITLYPIQNCNELSFDATEQIGEIAQVLVSAMFG